MKYSDAEIFDVLSRREAKEGLTEYGERILREIEASLGLDKDKNVPARKDDIEEVEIKFPKWDKPSTWEMFQVKALKPGDGLVLAGRMWLVVRKLRFRTRIANYLIHEMHDPTSMKRVGEDDWVQAYQSYVHFYNMDKMGVGDL